MSKKQPKITLPNLKDLGLFTPYDVSKWCIRHGIQSIYLVNEDRKIMDVHRVVWIPASWVLYDAKYPGKVLKRFTKKAEQTPSQLRATAVSWTEAQYDIPMKLLPAANGMFPAPAVDLLEQEATLLKRIWSLEPEVREEVPVEVTTRFLQDYPRVPSFAKGTALEEVLL